MCHRAAFPDSLASRLGQRYVVKMISWYLADEDRILVHLEANGTCVGYLGALLFDGTRPGSVSGLMQFSLGAAARSLLARPWLLAHPTVRGRLPLVLKNLRVMATRLLRKAPEAPPDSRSSGREAEMRLVVIAVSPEHQGQGFGSRLLAEAESISRRRGVRLMRLAVKTTNVQALRAYTRNHWQIAKAKGGSYEMTKEVRP